MSSGYLYGNDIFNDVEYYEQKTGKKTNAESKGLKRLLTLIGIVLAIELIWLFGVSPCMPLKSVSISGIPGIDEKAVCTLAGIGAQASYMTVNALAAEQALLSMPMVRSARVVKHFPNRIEINLESHRAAAITLIETGMEQFPALIGGDGTLFAVGADILNTETALPVISGLVLEGAYPGMKLPRIYSSLFEKLEALNRDAPQLIAAISEIHINQKKYDGFDLTLFPANQGVRVRVSDELTEETIRYMFLMLDVLSDKPNTIKELDFRTGTASYQIKEAQSG